MKMVRITGNVSMVGVNGIAVEGVEDGTGEEWKVRLANKGNAAFHDISLGDSVTVQITVSEEPANG